MPDEGKQKYETQKIAGGRVEQHTHNFKQVWELKSIHLI